MLNICDGCRWWQKLKDWHKEKEKAGWYSVFLVRKAITSFPLDTISTAHQLCLFLYLFVTPLFSSSSSFLTYQPSPFHFPLCFFPNLPFAHSLITPLRLICPLFFPLHSLLSGWPLSEFLFVPHIPFVVSGERDTLLSRLADLLSSSSPQIGIHFEMASFVEESIMEDLLHYVIPHVCMTE